MDERWQEIERLYHAARELDKTARAAFLAQACDGDDDLRREVERLLVQADWAGSMLNPNYAFAHDQLGIGLAFQGRLSARFHERIRVSLGILHGEKEVSPQRFHSIVHGGIPHREPVNQSTLSVWRGLHRVKITPN